MMEKSRAEQIIVISLFVLLASTIGSRLVRKSKESEKERQKTYGKLIVGGFFTILFAALLAEVAPLAGAGLSVSVASLAFFKEGLPVLTDYYGKPENKPTAAGPASKIPETRA